MIIIVINHVKIILFDCLIIFVCIVIICKFLNLSDTKFKNYNIKNDIMFTSEMKYNRMVLYEARQNHGAILDRKMYKQHPRLAQVFFM